ncbi:hypothetical protein [Streptomyces fumanus]|nr:hypothetical protein [Streptomyces fumanus]
MDNRTRRIGEPTMQMLLSWAIRFTEDFAGDILAAHAESVGLHARTTMGRRRSGPRHHRQPRHLPGELAPKVTAYLEDLRARGEALPGRRLDNGDLVINWRYVAAALNCAESFSQTTTARLVRESGLPIREFTYLETPINGVLDGQP